MVARTGSKKDKGGSKGSSFVYKKRNADDVKKRAEQTGGRFDSPFKQGFDVFRPKNGESQVRILPASWEDHDHYGFDVWMHRFVGADNSNYLCANKMLGKKCAVCVEQKLAKDAGEDQEAKDLAPVKRSVVWLIDRDDKADPPVPQLWEMSWTQDRDIAALCHTERTGKILLIDHPDDGYDIIIKKTGQGLKTRYSFIIDRESTPICDDVDDQDDILAFITENPVPDTLRYDTFEHVEKQMSGTSESKDEELDDDKPRGRKRSRDDDDDEKPRGRGRARDEDDDEKPRGRRGRDKDDDDDDDRASRRRRDRDDDDPDDETTERGSRGRSRAKDDDDDKPARRGRGRDADDDDDKPARRGRERADEDDDDKPRGRRSREEPEDDDKPARRGRGRDADDDDDKPARRGRERVDEEEDDKPSRRGRARDDDDAEERPARRSRR